MNPLMVPRYYSSPLRFATLGVGFPFITMSPSLLMFSMWSLHCFAEAVPFFFRRNCSVNRSIFGMFMEEVNSGSSYITILDLPTGVYSFSLEIVG